METYRNVAILLIGSLEKQPVRNIREKIQPVLEFRLTNAFALNVTGNSKILTGHDDRRLSDALVVAF